VRSSYCGHLVLVAAAVCPRCLRGSGGPCWPVQLTCCFALKCAHAWGQIAGDPDVRSPLLVHIVTKHSGSRPAVSTVIEPDMICVHASQLAMPHAAPTMAPAPGAPRALSTGRYMNTCTCNKTYQDRVSSISVCHVCTAAPLPPTWARASAL